jgi:6,7-dimethyl-8-ribityllumazine synthase
MSRLLEEVAPDPAARWAVVAARFHAEITDALVAGAEAGFAAHGIAPAAVEVVRVPGAFELPLACQELARTGRYAAVIALGCVVRGETSHYDFVAGECCRGVMDAGLATGVPVILGVLTVETLAQARQRASREALRGSAPRAGERKEAGAAPPASNKGWESAEAALAMAGLLRAARAGGAR